MGAVEMSQFTCAAEGVEPTTATIEAAANPFAMPKLAKILDMLTSAFTPDEKLASALDGAVRVIGGRVAAQTASSFE